MSIKRVIATAIMGIMALGLGFGTPALADDGDKTDVFAALEVVAVTDLDSTRGMHIPDFEDLEGTLQAVLDGNTSIVGDGVILTNTIDTSFNGASGIATVIQNVGNNVIIQTATMVTVNYNQ
jgi:hypothetical protein